MFFYLFNRNKTIRELRKNVSLTAAELALKIRCDTVDILKIDRRPLKEIPLELREKLLPIFRGDHFNKIPW